MEPTINKLRLGAMDNCVYIVSSPTTQRGVIVDAAAEPDRILAACAGLQIESILTTHGHHDHTGAVDDVREALDIPFRLHPADRDIAGRAPDVPLEDGEEIVLNDVTITTIHTPGHTPGSTCFLVDGSLLTGDTLFPGGPGATRWDYSDFDQIMDSVEVRLMVYPDGTPIRPGHGEDTSVGTERPHLEEWRERGW
ncbi:MAG: MBL fold metallo-hydrolase [Acidimicrobiia bacterium]|nr:MBL fold metallo-hydrolase [Acidimicrobiia bacterium]